MKNCINTVLKSYNVIGDDIYYHHTLSERLGESYYHEPGAHHQHEVLLLLRGEVSYIIEGETYRVTEGDMIFVSPNEIHTLKINGAKPYERIVLLFDMRVLDELMRELKVELGAFSYVGKNRFHVIGKEQVAEHGLDKLLFDIISYDEEDKYKRLLIMSKLIRFIVGIDKMTEKTKDNFVLPDFKDKLITAAADYVDGQIGKPIRLDDMAKALLTSKSTLCHRFASVMNMTVNQYIATKRMHLAEELLREGLSATEVAARLGYDNYTSFYYNFKRIMGRSPTAKCQVRSGDGARH